MELLTSLSLQLENFIFTWTKKQEEMIIFSLVLQGVRSQTGRFDRKSMSFSCYFIFEEGGGLTTLNEIHFNLIFCGLYKAYSIKEQIYPCLIICSLECECNLVFLPQLFSQNALAVKLIIHWLYLFTTFENILCHTNNMISYLPLRWKVNQKRFRNLRY